MIVDPTRDIAAEAAGAIQIAIRRVAHGYPFHAALIATFRICASSTIMTAGVTIREEQVHLVYNPEFVARCTLPQLEGVLHHELNHVIFGHILLEPEDYPDDDALVIATEVTVNEFVREPLPGKPILLSQFRDLPPDESTDERYRRLARPGIRGTHGSQGARRMQGSPGHDGDNNDRGPPGSIGPTNMQGPTGPVLIPPEIAGPAMRGPPGSVLIADDGEVGDTGQPGIAVSTGIGRRDGSAVHESAQVGPNSVRLVPKHGSVGPNSGPPQPLDDHDLWAEARASGEMGRLVVRESVRTARDTLTASQIAALPAAIRDAADVTAGDQPGYSMEHLGDNQTQGQLDWRVLLRRYIRRELEIRPSFTRPPRRFPDLVGIVPGHAHRRTQHKPVVMAVVDTSASMDTPILEDISTELNILRRHYKVTVVECDALVHAIYKLTGPLATVHGRGGTDFHPPFERNVLAEVRPDVVVYFTDGHGPAPSRAPRVPVIWCLTPNGEVPAPWGRVIRLRTTTNRSTRNG